MTIPPERLAILDAALSDSLDSVRATAGSVVLIAIARHLKRLGHTELMLSIVMGEWLTDATGEASQKICKAALTRMEQMLLAADAGGKGEAS